VSVLERSLLDKRRDGRATAQVIAALSIGGMVVARTLVDRAHADQLRATCLAAALELGGWDKPAMVPPGSRRTRADMRSGGRLGAKT